jgi:hypothetical protein
MDRREFIGYGTAAALSAAFISKQIAQEAEAASTEIQAFELHMEEIYEELIDGEVVFALAYRDPVTRALRPPLRLKQGVKCRIKLVNKTRKPRRFAITGFAADKFPVIAPGATATINFNPPFAGSYIYHENTEGAAGRVVGLHGAMVVWSGNCKTNNGTNTPFHNSMLTPEATALFEAFGKHYDFPGGKWRRDLPERDRIWLFSQIDPLINQAAEQGITIDLSLPVYRFRPRYFTINGLSGYDAAHDEHIVPKGYIGEPHLIRTMNAGIAAHAPHIHGNHVVLVSSTNKNGSIKINDNCPEQDTWLIRPLERIDVMLPFKKPDEIPAAAWPPKQEPWPLLYPMHCHCEMSQTAGGGNYPQGMVTHWELLGTKRVVA